MRNRIYNLIEPNNPNWVSRMYDYIMIAAIIAGLIPLAFRQQESWMIVLDKVSCAIFIIDYVLRWICADKSGKKGVASFFLYPFRPMAIIDLLSILPSITVLNSAFKLFRVTRLLKILRLVKVIRYYAPLQIMFSVIKKEASTLITVFLFACFYILLTALIMFNVEPSVNPVTGEQNFESFFDAVYWSACTLTTVGYGDIYPVTNVGRLFCILSSLVGVAIIALPSGIITAGYLRELKEQKTND